MNINSKHITLISGSLRNESFNTKVLKNIEKEIISQGYTTTFVDLNDFPIPFYNEDIELKGVPSNVFMLKNIIVNSSGLIISSPEYNGEISAVLKNTLDWLSRKIANDTPKQNFLGLKTIAVGASTGKNGANRSIERLQVLLERLGVDKNILKFSLAKCSSETFDNNNNFLANEQKDIIKNLIFNYLGTFNFNKEALSN